MSNMQLLNIIQAGVMIGITIAWQRIVRLQKRAAYWQGRLDELHAQRYCEGSFESYWQITGNQVMGYMGQREYDAWAAENAAPTGNLVWRSFPSEWEESR